MSLEERAEAHLRRVYVVNADDRQKRMGLSYVTAETSYLAREMARFAELVMQPVEQAA